METNKNPLKNIAKITYDRDYINVNDVRFPSNPFDHEITSFYDELLREECVMNDITDVVNWTMISKYLTMMEFTHVDDSEHDGIVTIDQYLADVEIFIKEML